MRCPGVERLLSDYIDGALSPEQKGRIEEHLSRCPDCKERLEELHLLNEEIVKIPLKEPSQHYWDTYLSRLERRIEERAGAGKSILQFRRIIGLSAAAASILVAIFTVNLIFRERPYEKRFPRTYNLSDVIEMTGGTELDNMAVEYFDSLLFLEMGEFAGSGRYFENNNEMNEIYQLVNTLSSEEKRVFFNRLFEENKMDGGSNEDK